MMSRRTVFGSVLAVFALLGVPGGSFADGGDILFETCADPSDSAMRAFLRASCDENATGPRGLYRHGVVRPANPNDSTATICIKAEEVFVCVGVPSLQ